VALDPIEALPPQVPAMRNLEARDRAVRAQPTEAELAELQTEDWLADSEAP